MRCKAFTDQVYMGHDNELGFFDVPNNIKGGWNLDSEKYMKQQSVFLFDSHNSLS